MKSHDLVGDSNPLMMNQMDDHPKFFVLGVILLIQTWLLGLLFILPFSLECLCDIFPLHRQPHEHLNLLSMNWIDMIQPWGIMINVTHKKLSATNNYTCVAKVWKVYYDHQGGVT
jgi:hypothetical protein